MLLMAHYKPPVCDAGGGTLESEQSSVARTAPSSAAGTHLNDALAECACAHQLGASILLQRSTQHLARVRSDTAREGLLMLVYPRDMCIRHMVTTGTMRLMQASVSTPHNSTPCSGKSSKQKAQA